jgi:hypothetical protein
MFWDPHVSDGPLSAQFPQGTPNVSNPNKKGHKGDFFSPLIHDENDEVSLYPWIRPYYHLAKWCKERLRR